VTKAGEGEAVAGLALGFEFYFIKSRVSVTYNDKVEESKGFEPLIGINPYTLSRRAL
jgi:hypothetical protein|tara:strand:- start:134 stop:304 length:171 start_codon:yes stop_codon:yes gene_type:complete